MTDSQMDVFGPGFVPGKVSTARDVVSRAMSRTPNTQLGTDEMTGARPGSGLDVTEHASVSSEV